MDLCSHRRHNSQWLWKLHYILLFSWWFDFYIIIFLSCPRTRRYHCKKRSINKLFPEMLFLRVAVSFSPSLLHSISCSSSSCSCSVLSFLLCSSCRCTSGVGSSLLGFSCRGPTGIDSSGLGFSRLFVVFSRWSWLSFLTTVYWSSEEDSKSQAEFIQFNN